MSAPYSCTPTGTLCTAANVYSCPHAAYEGQPELVWTSLCGRQRSTLHSDRFVIATELCEQNAMYLWTGTISKRSMACPMSISTKYPRPEVIHSCRTIAFHHGPPSPGRIPCIPTCIVLTAIMRCTAAAMSTRKVQASSSATSKIQIVSVVRNVVPPGASSIIVNHSLTGRRMALYFYKPAYYACNKNLIFTQRSFSSSDGFAFCRL